MMNIQSFGLIDAKYLNPTASGDPWELYNLSYDRAESNNLASAMPSEARRLEKSWKGMVDDFTDLVNKTLGQQPKGKRKRK